MLQPPLWHQSGAPQTVGRVRGSRQRARERGVGGREGGKEGGTDDLNNVLKCYESKSYLNLFLKKVDLRKY